MTGNMFDQINSYCQEHWDGCNHCGKQVCQDHMIQVINYEMYVFNDTLNSAT